MEKSIRYVSQIKALCSTSHERVRPKSKYTSVSSPQINMNTKQFIGLVYQCVKSLVIYLEHFDISHRDILGFNCSFSQLLNYPKKKKN